MRKHHKIKHNPLEEIYALGMHYYDAQDFHKAYLYMSWLSIADAKNSQVWFLKGICEQNLKKYPEALVTYNHVIAIEPGFIYVYQQIMNCLILMGDLKNAKHVYEIFTHDVDKKSYSDDKYIVDNLECIKNCLA
jgi:tetratricopeptide (TPR) repeat protein